MADFTSTVLGLLKDQENKQSFYTDPASIQNQMDKGVAQNLAQQHLDLSKQHLNLQAQGQLFNQDIQSKQMAITQDQYQYQKKLNDLMFPLQQQEIQAKTSLLPETYEAQRLDLIGKQNAQRKQVQSQSLANGIVNQLQSMSPEDWDNGVPEGLIAQHRPNMTDSDSKALEGIIEQRHNTLQMQLHKQEQYGSALWGQQMQSYQEQVNSVNQAFDNMPYKSSQERDSAKFDYLKNNGLLTPPSRAPFSFTNKGGFKIGNAPKVGGGSGKAGFTHDTATGSARLSSLDKELNPVMILLAKGDTTWKQITDATGMTKEQYQSKYAEREKLRQITPSQAAPQNNVIDVNKFNPNSGLDNLQ